MDQEEKMSKEEGIDERADKPHYDARLQYYAVLKSAMDAQVVAMINNDYFLLERSLRQLLSMVRKFTKIVDYNQMRDNLNKAKRYLLMNNSSYDYYIDKLLEEVQEEIYYKAAQVFLPFSEDVNEEFDMDEFLRGSGL